MKESLIHRLKGRHTRSGFFWALHDVSFSLEQGRVLGIIGHNGAGKSTLLRLICGLGRPTSGRVMRAGSVGALLELGSGFHPEMTGRENLMTGGILSGLTKREVRAKEDEIIAFAELEEFIDQPVRTYSSGMYMRLAFAAAVNFDPDFLVIDEVLAVGDDRFQSRCLERINTFRKGGKGLVLVSHNLEQVRGLCDEVVVLEEGRVAIHADPESAIKCYYDLMTQRTERKSAELFGNAAGPDLAVEKGRRTGTQEASISAVRLYDSEERPIAGVYGGHSLTIELEYTLNQPVADLAMTLGIFTDTNIKCFETFISSACASFGLLSRRGSFICKLSNVPLLAGIYYVNAGLFPTDWSYVYDYHQHMHALQIVDERNMSKGASGFVLVHPTWSHVNRD
jgi:lipopolysaccharide transport system ATP-binding protein